MDDCPYTDICRNYNGDCVHRHWYDCWSYRTFEGLLDKHVFEEQIYKKVKRDD